jgi:hypothetical protein
MLKDAWKADADAGLEKAAQIDIKALASDGTDRLREFWDKLSPETKSTLVNSLIGGALGGGAMGGMGMLSAPEGQGLHRAIGSGVLGAILGALAGGAGTAGYHAAAGGRRLPGEIHGHHSLGDRLSNALVGTAWSHPALTTGGLAGGYFSGRGLLDTIKGISKSRAAREEKALAGSHGPLADLAHMDVIDAAEHLGGDFGPPLKMVAALPLGVGAGYLLDKYIKGQYD